MDDGNAEVVAQILAHAVLESWVLRFDHINPTTRWQDVESAGLCSLLHTGESSAQLISTTRPRPPRATGGEAWVRTAPNL